MTWSALLPCSVILPAYVSQVNIRLRRFEVHVVERIGNTGGGPHAMGGLSGSGA